MVPLIFHGAVLLNDPWPLKTVCSHRRGWAQCRCGCQPGPRPFRLWIHARMKLLTINPVTNVWTWISTVLLNDLLPCNNIQFRKVVQETYFVWWSITGLVTWINGRFHIRKSQPHNNYWSLWEIAWGWFGECQFTWSAKLTASQASKTYRTLQNTQPSPKWLQKQMRGLLTCLLVSQPQWT